MTGIKIFKPKDFLETAEGLVFAVVARGEEDDRALAFLRYVLKEGGRPVKFNTEQANTFLRQSHPSYLFHSLIFDADLHGVPLVKIVKHHQPTEKLKALMSATVTQSQLQKTLKEFIQLLMSHEIQLEHLGVTGSFLIGAESEKSDIDLVIYDRDVFYKLRHVINNLIDQNKLFALDNTSWQESYARRGCSLTFEEYVWHEKRKYNKAVFKGVKIDLSLVTDSVKSDKKVYLKKGKVKFSALVTDDQYAFDSPCSYTLNHSSFKKVICFTPTYAGQAVIGDTVEISGFLEESADGKGRRIIVGTSREAPGEYIRVIK